MAPDRFSDKSFEMGPMSGHTTLRDDPFDDTVATRDISSWSARTSLEIPRFDFQHEVDTNFVLDGQDATTVVRNASSRSTLRPTIGVDPRRADSRAPKERPQETEKDPYEHLPEDEAAILKRQALTPDVKTGFFALYRYASRNDKLVILAGSIAAIAAGAALPMMTIIFGNLQGTFQDYFYPEVTEEPLTEADFRAELNRLVLYFVYLAVGEFFASYISTVAFIYTGEHISAKIREHYLESCMKQNIGFFDNLGSGEVTTRITADTNRIQEGISEKVALTIGALATFATAFVIGFFYYWRLTLILTSTFVVLLLIMGGGSIFVGKYNKQAVDSYALGGSLAEEVISSVRNSIAFGTQDRLARRYDAHLITAERSGFKVQTANGLMIAGLMACLYLNYGMAFWMGSKYLQWGHIELKDVLIIMMAIMMGSFNIGNVAPNIQAFTAAVGAAGKIYNTIDRVSPLDSSREKGKILRNLQGHIRLENVKHIYPSRPDVVVMDGVTLDIPAGKTTALVGASGSGKSTIVGLVERFYNPVQGTIHLDGRDISTLNLRWLRQQMALVSQEPTLFATTIFRNIQYGLIGTRHENSSAADQLDLIVNAAKKANAHDFISSLPEGYETNVGERGFLMSGGQKQRIAIARAIVSDPKILLLDEATSALDTKSEGVVQAALENASAGRTTITIAHRLSTIRDAHNIVVMSKGHLVEQGTHNELLERRGAYFNLVTAQEISKVNEAEAEKHQDIEIEEEELDFKSSHRQSGSTAANEDDKLATKLHRMSTIKSTSSVVVSAPEAEPAAKKHSLWTLVKLIGSFNKKEWHIMLFGLIWCVICGGGNPTQAVLFAKQITTLSQPFGPDEARRVRDESNFWSWMYLMLGLSMLLAFSVQGVIFAKCSERLVHRIRDRAFRTMLRQDVAFFDKEENTAGALTSFLATETTHMAGLSGSTLATLLLLSTTLVAAMCVAFAIGWKLALVCSATVPVLLACGFFRFWMLSHFEQRSKAAYAKSANYASEAISAIRTVASLTREKDVLKDYRESLAGQQKRSLRSVLRSSALFAASQSMMFLAFALGFWYGGTLIAQWEYTMFQFFVCFSAVVFGAQSAGTIFSFAPDMGKAHNAAGELKTLFDRRPNIDTWSGEGESLAHVDGMLEFRGVRFNYPTRPEHPVLRGINLTIRPGQYVALVGGSGSGKSTTIALLERFYDPHSGSIHVDGKDISSLNVNSYRSHIALVSQEPTLYSGTIRDNIVLGTPDENVTDEAVEHACREANIYDFIVSLPDGFNTTVGSKGALLSGGQKQRIAIARALIRDPKILLLDEATSALDSESEYVVQAALDKASRGRTTIAVAHRLSTIQKADVIYVFDQGRIVESGGHAELMKADRRYAELVNLQTLEKRS